MGEQFPRELSGLERALLLWMLPAERPGYNEYRTLVQEWKVMAQGRRGEGNYILGPVGECADNESPLPQILAYGIVETTSALLSVTLRERLENQLEFEIQSIQGEFDPAQFQETRRWTYSSWLPGVACPSCRRTVREIPMSSGRGQLYVLVACIHDERIWVHDQQSGVNHLIPVSNFYNELMLHKNIRDPNVALNAKNLFRDLGKYSDADLKHAFRTYNRVRSKIALFSDIVVEEPRQSFFDRMKFWQRRQP
jgi:hypothetical protein